MSNTDGTCEYVLDPDDPETWGGDEGDKCYLREEILNENEVWACPHTAEEGEELCIFHLPENKKDLQKVERKLFEVLGGAYDGGNYTGEEKNQFVGGIFGRIDITEYDENLSNVEKVVDFNHSEFRGVVNFSEEDINANLTFAGSVFHDRVIFREVNFEGRVNLHHVKFESKVSFSGSRFGGKAFFFESVFEGERSNKRGPFDSVTFESITNFEHSEFIGTVSFLGSDIDGNAIFNGAKFDNAVFHSVNFYSNASFSSVNFSYVQFTKAHFYDTASFASAQFEGRALFNSTTFEGNVNFNTKMNQAATFSGDVNFNEASLEQGSDFRKLDLKNASFRGAKVQNGNFWKADLTGANLSDALLNGTNLERAILIRTDLFGTELYGAAIYGAIFEGAQINEETDFGDRCMYDPTFNHSNKTTAAIVEDGTDLLTKAAGQYRIIEQLSRTNAFPDMVSHNFVRRQDIHREQHRQKGRWGRWLRATASKYVLEYGENPWRLIATGLIIVVGFGLLYPLVGGLQPTGGSPITASRVIENPLLLAQSIYYSTLTFTTLGMGDFLPVGLGRVLTTLETSLGAIIIALLVFVFGRRAAR